MMCVYRDPYVSPGNETRNKWLKNARGEQAGIVLAV
jgi:hypothetical protein